MRGYPFIRDCAPFLSRLPPEGAERELAATAEDGYYTLSVIFGEADMKDPMKSATAGRYDPLPPCALMRRSRPRMSLSRRDLRKDWQERLDNLPGDYRRGKNTTDYQCIARSRSAGTPPVGAAVLPQHQHVDGVLKPPDSQRRHLVRGPADDLEDRCPTRERLSGPRRRRRLPSCAATAGHANPRRRSDELRPCGQSGRDTDVMRRSRNDAAELGGAVNVFPALAKDMDAGFRNWRAQGAFLVSPRRRRKVVRCEIFSEGARTA